MPLTTKRFVWKDRDTAARDMLQLAYHAPITISRQALQLLQAFRSLAIMPELKELVLDETRDIWERRYALYALAEIPGDIWFPKSPVTSGFPKWPALPITSRETKKFIPSGRS